MKFSEIKINFENAKVFLHFSTFLFTCLIFVLSVFFFFVNLADSTSLFLFNNFYYLLVIVLSLFFIESTYMERRFSIFSLFYVGILTYSMVFSEINGVQGVFFCLYLLYILFLIFQALNKES